MNNLAKRSGWAAVITIAAVVVLFLWGTGRSALGRAPCSRAPWWSGPAG